MDIYTKHLTGVSKDKLIGIYPKIIMEPIKFNHYIDKLRNDMVVAQKAPMDMIPLMEPDINSLKKLFIDFDREFNMNTESVFISQVKSMGYTYSIKLNGTITLNFLTDTNDTYIPIIIHAVHTFSNLFPYNYVGLTINVCLDNTHRSITCTGTVPKIFECLHRESSAFNVSGLTRRSDKMIIVTKKEEIVKLIYHELVHYIGLDHELIGIDYTDNLSEAYTEFMAIILNTAYISMLYNKYHELLNAEIKYSVWLTAAMLKFFGYTNVQGFFRDNLVIDSPILTQEYVVIRTQLLLNINKIAELVGPDKWRINSDKVDSLVKLMKITPRMVELVGQSIMYIDKPINVSYTLIDLDWDSIYLPN